MNSALETEEAVEETQIISVPVQTVIAKLLGAGDGADVPRSNLIDLSESMGRIFGTIGAIEPPLDPLSLVRLNAMSSALRPLVDAMAANVHGFGFRFEPTIDLDAADALSRVRAAMLIEAEIKAESEIRVGQRPRIETPTDAEVSKRLETLRVQMRREKAQLEVFFSNCSRKVSFSRLCRKMQVDKETTGYGVVEVRRDRRGEVSRLTYGPSWTFRAMAQGAPIEREVKVRATDVSYRTVKEFDAFRRYVQVFEANVVYFKEFGDPRLMSASSGIYYQDEEAMRKAEPTARAATELLWFSLDSPESETYGAPRWSGCIPGVIGSREAAEVNLIFFRSKAIPPMVVLVSGGRLARGARERLQEVVEKELKGINNFHKILIIEAEPIMKVQGAGGLPTQDRVKIEFRPLTEAIFRDAGWLDYQNRNRMELGQAFRLPPLLSGNTENLNRSTAQVAQQYSEQQVFVPERQDFEFDVDRTVLADLGISLWRFKLNGPKTTDAEQLVDYATRLVDATVTVNEARRFIGQAVFGQELAPLETDWGDMPLKQSLGGFSPESQPPGDVSKEPAPHRITVPRDLMESLVEREG